MSAGNGVEVTLRTPKGERQVLIAKLTIRKGVNGGDTYRNDDVGFGVEILEGPDGTQQIADFGWGDGRRGYDIINVWPVIVG